MGASRLFVGGLVVLLVFALGFVFAQIWDVLSAEDVRLSPDAPLFSPANWVDEDEILVTEGGVLVLVEGAWVANYGSTGSMVPLLDEGANGIVVERECGLLELGDVVSYHNSNGEIVVHRIVGTNGDGFLVKGDNSPEVESIGCEDVVGVLVGVIY